MLKWEDNMPKQNIEIVKTFFEAAPKSDLAGARAVLDPNIEWIEPEVAGLWFGGVHRGADAALEEVVKPTFQNVSNFSVAIDEYLDAGDNVVAVGRFEGTARDTGMALNIPVCFICTVRAGKIVLFRAFHNTARWLEVMGQLAVA